tara:strand:+ start:201 stop:830 length:630 start_codon:yes stop_codon:yes gene_type:complete
MSTPNVGVMIVLSSPSGAGKTTLVKKISKQKNYVTSISHTTRKPRTNEKDGIDYYFVSQKVFKELVNKKEFLEYAKVFNNYYGTSEKNVLDKLNTGKNVIFDIDWQGAEQIKKKNLNYKLITFFILPPSRQVLFQRLSNRDMKDKLIVEERMKQFEKDILHWENYDFVVINDDLNLCYKQIYDFINAKLNNLPKQYNQEIIKKHIKALS